MVRRARDGDDGGGIVDTGRPDPKDIGEDTFIRMLLDDREMARATGQAAAAVRAAELIGKAKGLLVERAASVVLNADVGDLEIAQRIAYLLASEPPQTVIDVTPAPLGVDTVNMKG